MYKLLAKFHLFTLTNQLFNKLLWLCSLYASSIYVCTYGLSLYSFLFCVRVFWYSYFREGNPFYETRLNFQVSILLSQRGSPINSGDLVRYWADPARHVHWVEAGMLQIGLLAPFHWKKRLPLASFWLWKHAPLCACTPTHCTQYNNDREWRSPHWTNLQTHKGTGMLLGITVWGLLLICRVRDPLLMLYYPWTRISQGKACQLTSKVWGHPHEYKANVTVAWPGRCVWVH